MPAPLRLLVLVALVSWIAAPVHAVTGGEEPPDLAYRAGQVLVKLTPAAARVLEDPTAPDPGAPPLRPLLDRLGVTGSERALAVGGGAAAPGRVRAARVAQRFARRGQAPPDESALPDVQHTFRLELDEDSDVWAAIAELRAHPGVLLAEPNYLLHVAALPLPDEAFLPDDPFVSRDGATWAERFWGQPYPDLWGIRITRSIEGWNRFDADGSGAFEPGEARPGEGVVVAVIDTGLDRAHPDIAVNVWQNPGEIPANGVDDDGNGFVDDVHGWDFVEFDAEPQDPNGHGTHVAGTVAATANNGIDVVGVAPWAMVLPLRGLDESGSGDVFALAGAVEYAADAGADVISASWGGLGVSEVLAEAFDYARALGVVAVAAAGNANGQVASFHPANLESVIAVAATDFEDVRAGFSNFGIGIDLAAPGVDVLSLSANGGDNALVDEQPGRMVTPDLMRISGTSMACPHVSGAAAVLLSLHPDATPDEIRARLRVGAHPIADLNPGYENALGAGRLDLEASLLAPPRPVIELRELRSGAPAPGSEVELVVTLSNLWETAHALRASLVSRNPLALVTQGGAELGDLGPGQTVDNEPVPFRVLVAPETPFGIRLDLELVLEAEGGFRQVVPLELALTFFRDTLDETGLPLEDAVPWRIVPRDYDGDDNTDVLFVGFLRTRLFRKRLSGRFADTTGIAGVIVSGVITNEGIFSDFDDDGLVDLYIGGYQNGTRLFRNETGLRFGEVTDETNVLGRQAFTTVPLDWDRDGRLDLLGATFETQPAFLLRSLGALGFQDRIVQTCLPVSPDLSPGQIVTLDYDLDGDTDLIWGSFRTPFTLFRNEGDGTFTDVTRDAGLERLSDVACRPKGRWGKQNDCEGRPALGIAVGDIDNDGDPDLFVTGSSLDRGLLFRNRGGKFQDVSSISGDLSEDELHGLFWGNVFFDFDNDGDLDLYVTNDGTGSRVHSLYANDGKGRFSRVTDVAFPGPATPGGAAAAVMDENGDGALDVYAPSGILGGGFRGALFENVIATRNGNHWLRVALEGVASSRDPFGAQVRVEADGRTLLREMRYAAIEPQPLHFGLGAETSVALEVIWPSGLVQRVEDVGADRTISLVEPVHCLMTPADPTCAGVSLHTPPQLPRGQEKKTGCTTVQGRPPELRDPGARARGPKAAFLPPEGLAPGGPDSEPEPEVP